jgi:hypothetical protein
MNWYRKALQGVFSRIMSTGAAPIGGLVTGVFGKQLSAETLDFFGWNKGLGRILYGSSSALGKAAGKASRTAVRYGFKGAGALGAGAREFLREEIPAFGRAAGRLWKAATVEAADEPLGRMLKPTIQTGVFVGITGFGAAKGLGAYTVSRMPAPVDLGYELPHMAYDGMIDRRALHESTYGLVQALNALR